MAKAVLGWVIAGAVVLAAGAAAHAETATRTITNHTGGTYSDELVRLQVDLKTPWDAGKLRVREGGKDVPFQVEVLEGTAGAVVKGDIWVSTTLAPKESRTYEVSTDGGGSPAVPERKVEVVKGDKTVTVKGGSITLEVPTGVEGMAGPIGRVAGDGVEIKGGSAWATEGLTIKKLDTVVLAEGPLFGKVRLRYVFADGKEGGAEKFSEITLTVNGRDPVVLVGEKHSMTPGSGWTLDLTRGVAGGKGYVQGWQDGPFKGNESLREVTLKPTERLGDTVALLQPRWTQGFDQAWQFHFASDSRTAGAMVGRAGRWVWPFDNLIEVKVKASGDSAGLFMPTWKGQRYWYVVLGDRKLAEEGKGMITRLAHRPLEKLVNEYDLEWPGLPAGGFESPDFYSSQMNPTGVIRSFGKQAVAAAKNANNAKPSRGTLSSVQAMFDPDSFGFYYNHWGPINPNFATDFLRVPIARTCLLKGHPEFEKFRKMAEDAFRMDLDHSVTLPGGAGQESPGYTVHAMSAWMDLAPLCKEHLGFDPTTWPRFKEAARFILRTSQPMGGGKRRILPLGDTHPTGPDVFALAQKAGVNDKVETFVTEEFPGFGAVLRSRSGKDDENFLAFKAGPNRGHNHGDQLSFHYAGNGHRLAIDHMCSYSPRADQEHMHNRVTFAVPEFKYANMDGYERLIAFKTGAEVDIAMGQVESGRLREQPRTPQEITWDPKGPYHRFATPLTYRRTVVMVKQPDGKGNDYYVVRDQWWGGDEKVKGIYALHVESDKAEKKGNEVDFGTMRLLVAEPAEAAFERFDWEFVKGKGGYGEKTAGARLTAPEGKKEFITVLWPSGTAPAWSRVEGGVKVGEDVVTFGADGSVKVTRGGKEKGSLAASEIDLKRPQGEVGLFVPECGYDFGPIPEWLIEQRGAMNPRVK